MPPHSPLRTQIANKHTQRTSGKISHAHTQHTYAKRPSTAHTHTQNDLLQHKQRQHNSTKPRTCAHAGHLAHIHSPTPEKKTHRPRLCGPTVEGLTHTQNAHKRTYPSMHLRACAHTLSQTHTRTLYTYGYGKHYFSVSLPASTPLPLSISLSLSQ